MRLLEIWPHVPIHVDQAAQRQRELGKTVGNTVALRAPHGHRECRSAGSGAPGSNPGGRLFHPVCIGVAAEDQEKDDGQDDEQVDEHADQRRADQDTQVLGDAGDVEPEEVGQDEEEDTDGRNLDQPGDDNCNDLLNLLDDLEDWRVWLEEISNDDGGDEDGQKTIVGQRTEDILRNEGLKHLLHNIVNLGGTSLLDHLLVVLVGDLAIFFSHDLHKTNPTDGYGNGRV